MKTMLTLLGALALGIGTVAAAPVSPAAPSLEMQINRQMHGRFVLQTSPSPPSQVRGRVFTYSGILVQLAKTDHPLQLINPFAPARFGSGAQNTDYSPFNGRASGLKLVSLSF